MSLCVHDAMSLSKGYRVDQGRLKCSRRSLKGCPLVQLGPRCMCCESTAIRIPEEEEEEEEEDLGCLSKSTAIRIPEGKEGPGCQRGHSAILLQE